MSQRTAGERWLNAAASRAPNGACHPEPARTDPAGAPSGTPTPAQIRSDDVLKLHRLAHSGGSAAVLRWLGARLGGWAGVVGAVAGPDPHGTADPRTPELALRGAAELADRGLRSAVLDDGGSTALLFALGEGRALAAVLPRRTTRPPRRCWRTPPCRWPSSCAPKRRSGASGGPNSPSPGPARRSSTC
ncbi:hypothetical protein [Streptomyces globosus]|uniref:hypothetical protein n=1 Tax=Streptomyces globosus TaxID=68209 RepID=UPI0036334821